MEDSDPSENPEKETLRLEVASGTAVLTREKRSALVDAENTEFEVAGTNGTVLIMEANGFKEEIVD